MSTTPYQETEDYQKEKDRLADLVSTGQITFEQAHVMLDQLEDRATRRRK